MNLVENAKHLMVGTGAEWVLWLLLGLSVISIAVILERAYVFWSRRDDVEALREGLIRALRNGGFEEARSLLRRSRHPAALVALRGMRRDDHETSPEEAEEAMQAEATVQKSILESRLSYLGTLGANAPFIGLFGTVIGILQSFEELGKSAKAPTAQAAASAAAPQAVMSSLAEALVATAVGIGVAIPAVFAFNIFQRTSKTWLADADVLSRELLAYLHSDKAPAAKSEAE
ncbi:MAG: MotA/TolQ/ExbB proton channel family protein [Myxococcales bacterium]|nr:MotA/TolQ/ExbB proton channel family protein [Polyangiaceae bacterium]MDW8248818.1 MotA/TolQ/ExbB proton channel family protein [Myxococcales bacterium]